ncbi:Rrf2 family transcriptional regulator [Cyanobium sp. WAJ14-Wanaka]|nr:Rrf2 family transcriptional regulator [Cyanobium sp. WAJ14-Wanaka]
MAFSAKTSYGLLALMELASQVANQSLLQVAEIASRHQIPERYLEQVMAGLRRGGLVGSIRGAQGGYRLCRAPAEISLAAVVLLLEGDPGPTTLSAKASPEAQVLSSWSLQLDQLQWQKLEATNLQDLLELRDQHQHGQAMYFI